jgi:outer membrane protein assembly factor BamB
MADDRGNVYAVDAARGRLLWTVQVSGRPLGPLTVSGGDVLVTLAGEDRGLPVVEALDAKTGERRWQVAPDVFGSGATSGVAHDGAFFVGLPDRAVHSFDLSDGAPRWTSQAFFSLPAPFGAGAAYGDDVIFVFFADPSGDVRRLDGATGRTVWDFPLNEPVLRSPPVLSGSAVVLGMRDGSLAAIDAASGEQIFRSPPQGGLLGGIAVTPDLLVAVQGGVAGGLVAFEHDEGASITHVPSPSTLDPVDLVGRYAAAVAVIMVVLVAPLWYLGRRRSPALADSNDSLSDPIEDAAFGDDADDDDDPDDGRSGS